MDKQEPVAYYYENSPGKRGVSLYKETEEWQPLYTAPPKREWIGLTDEDIDEVERWVDYKEEGSGPIPLQKLTRYIEAKLKEKNT